MSTLTCLACGFEGRGVAMRLIEIPSEERREVGVRLPVAHREGAIEVEQLVPERYAPEPRCRDGKACAERVASLLLSGAGGSESFERVEGLGPLGTHLPGQTGSSVSASLVDPADDLGGWT